MDPSRTNDPDIRELMTKHGVDYTYAVRQVRMERKEALRERAARLAKANEGHRGGRTPDATFDEESGLYYIVGPHRRYNRSERRYIMKHPEALTG